jgi:hypothetical protein
MDAWCCARRGALQRLHLGCGVDATLVPPRSSARDVPLVSFGTKCDKEERAGQGRQGAGACPFRSRSQTP